MPKTVFSRRSARVFQQQTKSSVYATLLDLCENSSSSLNPQMFQLLEGKAPNRRSKQENQTYLDLNCCSKVQGGGLSNFPWIKRADLWRWWWSYLAAIMTRVWRSKAARWWRVSWTAFTHQHYVKLFTQKHTRQTVKASSRTKVETEIFTSSFNGCLMTKQNRFSHDLWGEKAKIRTNPCLAFFFFLSVGSLFLLLSHSTWISARSFDLSSVFIS